MVRIYEIEDDGTTREAAAIHCKDEERELQRLLELNPHMLPGEQIKPEDPRRFLVLGRELAVPDPSTAEDRWSIDVVLADQDAIPTLVECKRFDDTRSRREVVGQMLDYAANGQFYWDAKTLQQAAERHWGGPDVLAERVTTLAADWAEDVAGYFETMEFNLREGQTRLVFFLEKAPHELKSIADFLNKQMERTEVLVVEARQFEMDGRRIVAPQLFGYTEEARRAKRVVEKVRTDRPKWEEATFLAAAEQNAAPSVQAALRELLAVGGADGCEIKWGTARRGSFGVRVPGVGNATLVTAYSTGEMWMNLCYLSDSPSAIAARDLGISILEREFGIPAEARTDGTFPGIPIPRWHENPTAILEWLRNLGRSNFG